MKTLSDWKQAVLAGETMASFADWEPPAPPNTELRPFIVNCDRDVIQIDTFKRVVMACSYEEASALADQIADEANACCPDDIIVGVGGDCESWHGSVDENPTRGELKNVPVWTPADA